MQIIGRAVLRQLALLAVLSTILSACVTETVEVTRIKIMERRVIERVPVTVEVTRIQRMVNTPRPTSEEEVRVTATPLVEPSPSSPPASATPTRPQPTSGATATPAGTTKQVGESLLAALRSTEQTLLSLVQAVNSDPLPIDQTIQLYDALRSAPVLAVPDSQATLQSVYLRYREQIDYVLEHGTDLYAHAVKIQTGQAQQTQVSPIYLGLARDAASSGTSAIQALIRELESFLASQP